MKILITIIFIAVLLINGFAQKQNSTNTDSLTKIWDFEKNYKVDTYLREAIALQAMGQKKAINKLAQIAQNPNEFYKIYILCRMLFVAKKGGNFRRPRIGAPQVVYYTQYTDWPLEPITLVKGIPFLVTHGYSMAGFPELPDTYLIYCRKNCDWNKYNFSLKTEGEKQQALHELCSLSKLAKNISGSSRQYFRNQLN